MCDGALDQETRAGVFGGMRQIPDRVEQAHGSTLRFVHQIFNGIRLEVLLKGETEPIAITIDEYQLTNVAGAEFILINKASASREWINALLQDFAIGKTIPLPSKYSNMVKSLL